MDPEGICLVCKHAVDDHNGMETRRITGSDTCVNCLMCQRRTK